MAGLVRQTLFEPYPEPWLQAQDTLISAVLLAARRTPMGRLWFSFLQPGPLATPRLTDLFWTALRRIVCDDMRQAQEQILSRCNSVCAAVTREGAAIAGDIKASLSGRNFS